MIDLEARVRVIGIDGVGSWRAERGDADQRQDRCELPVSSMNSEVTGRETYTVPIFAPVDG